MVLFFFIYLVKFTVKSHGHGLFVSGNFLKFLVESSIVKDLCQRGGPKMSRNRMGRPLSPS